MKLRILVSKKLFLMVGILFSHLSYAQYPGPQLPPQLPPQVQPRPQLRDRLNYCERSDAVCVGQVLLTAIEISARQMQQIPVQPLPPQRQLKVVQLFRSDSCSSDFLAEVTLAGSYQDDQQLCEQKARLINNYVYGVKVNGVCINIQDTDFRTACIAQI